MLVFLLRMFFLPIIILMGIELVFSKLFSKFFFFGNQKLNKIYIKLQFVITGFFFSINLLKIYTGIMIVNQFSFNLIFIVGYVSTALFYLGINKQYVRPWLKNSIFFLSIILWMPVAIIANPYGYYFISAHNRSMLGIETELIHDSDDYRIEQLGIVPMSGGQHYYQVIEKSRIYEKKLDKFMEFPSRIDEHFKDYKDKNE